MQEIAQDVSAEDIETTKILVVDDEPDMQPLILQKFRRQIRKKELSFVFAQNGLEALEVLAQEGAIDIVLTDINMPKMDGLTLLGKIQELGPVPKTVVMSAYGDMENIRSAMNRGAYDFLTKPINFQDLETTLNKTVEGVTFLKQALSIQAEFESNLQSEVAEKTHELQNKLHVEQQLKGELESTSDALKNALVKAESATEAKSMFLANMSHEIRSPMTAIIGFAEALLHEKDQVIDRDELLRIIIRNGQHLLTILNDILDLSKIEAGQLRVEHISFNPRTVVDEVVATLKMLAEEKMISFAAEYQLPIPKIIHSDPTRFRQVLINLCNNAIKFTEHGNVKIIVSFDSENESLITQVCDTGIGMTDEEIEKLFKPFSQADESTTRRFGGTGLGLTISQWLCQQMGGDIKVSSLKDVGSKFTASFSTGTVPADTLLHDLNEADTKSNTSVPTPTVVPELSGAVLLAEDGRDNQQLVKMYVERTGASIHIVENGKEAFEAAQRGAYDLILMDVQMPVMGGVEATKLLRSHHFSKPIIALTANVLSDDIRTYIEAGCNDCLAKPIDRNRFYETLASYLIKADQHPDDKGDSGEDDIFKRLVGNFIASLPEYLEKIDSALAQDDVYNVAMQAHTLKGTGGSFGFNEISHAAATVEDKAKDWDGNKGVLQEACDHLKSICEKIIQDNGNKS